MNIDATTLDEFARLTTRGHELLHICGWDGRKYTAFKPAGLECMKFRAQALALIRAVFGTENEYHRRLQTLAEDSAASEKGYHLHEFLAVLETAHQQIQRQGVFDVPEDLLVALDFEIIELAEAMVNAGCHIPAAQRAGYLLDRSLRSMAHDRGVVDAESQPIDHLNDTLHIAGVYDPDVHRRIGAFAQIARDADGSDAHRINAEDVREMVLWIGRFLRKHTT